MASSPSPAGVSFVTLSQEKIRLSCFNVEGEAL